ncbi:MAG: PAS domain S-box protein, partial [Spirochaetota bacterium]
LLVEDEPVTAAYQKQALVSHGYSVSTVSTGEDAVSYIETHPQCDLILMDIDLGDGMDGTEAAGIILSRRNTPLVFLTSHTEPEIVNRTEKITSYGYVVKNAGIIVLDASIKMAFRLFEQKQLVNEQRQNLAAANEELEQANEELMQTNEELEEFYRIILEHENTLREKEIFLNRIIDQSPFAIWISDRDGTLIRANPALKNFLNLTDEQLVGRYNVLDDPLVHKQGLIPLVRNVYENGESVRFTCHWDGKDIPGLDLNGSKAVYIDVTMFPIKNSRQEITHVVLNWIDITERKKYENALLESEYKFRILVEQAADALLLHDLDGNICAVNRTSVNQYGYSREELLRMNVCDLDPDYTDRDNRGAFYAEMEYSVPRYFEARQMRKNGEIFPADVVITKILLNDETMIMGLCRDISALRRSYNELKTRERELEQVFDALPEALVYADPDRLIICVNPAFIRIFGYTPEEVLGKKTRIFYAHERDYQEQGLQRYNETARDMYEPYEIEYRRKDGTVFRSETVGTAVRDAEDNLIGFLALIRDISR